MLSKLKHSTPQQSAPLEIPVWENFLGQNTVDPAKLLLPNEVASCVNWKLNDNGKLETRCGLKRLTAADKALAGGKYFKALNYVPISGTYALFGISDDYKTYKITGAEAAMDPGASLGTLSGDAQIIPFGGLAVLADTGYLKATDGTTVYILYDNGTGATGPYLYNNVTADMDAAGHLFSGSTVQIAQLVTTPNLGYAWPGLGIELWLSKEGSPTGVINATIWDMAGTVVLTDNVKVKAQHLSANAKKFTFTFATNYSLTANTQYRFGISFTGGDGANYVKVWYDTVTSGGLLQSYTVAGGWTATDPNKNLCIGVKPGLPPKGAFGDVHETRLFIGGNPDATGKLFFGNANSPYDWSTPDGGGSISVIDDNANGFPIGAILAHYGQLFVAGKTGQPYLTRLSGTSPSAYSLESMNQAIGTHHQVFKACGNDVWFGAKDGISSLTGVEQYGDVRTFHHSDKVQNLATGYYTTAAFAAYNPDDGQYWIKLAGYSNTLVFHTKHPRKDPRTGKVVYPVTEVSFTSITPTCFAYLNGLFYVAANNGHLYRLDTALAADAGAAIVFTLEGGFMEMPFGVNNVEGAFISMGSSDTAAAATLSFYKDGSSTATKDLSVTYTARPTTYGRQHGINFGGESIKIKLHTLTATAKVILDRIYLIGRKLRRRY